MTGLEHLSDEELREYHRRYKEQCDKSSRFEMVKIREYDCKFAYHIIRLMDEVEQLMAEGTMDLQRAKEVMKAIRRGDWTADEVWNWAVEKNLVLEKMFTECKLPDKPPEEPLRQLLFQCLEEHYGTLEGCIDDTGWAEQALKDIDKTLDKYRKQLYTA